MAVTATPCLAVCLSDDQVEDIEGFSSLGTCQKIDLKDFENKLVPVLSQLTTDHLTKMKRAAANIYGDGRFLKTKISEYLNESF